MSNFSIKLNAASQQIINNLAAAGKIDLRPILSVIGIGYRKEVALIFAHQQPRDEDQQWAPLSAQYAKWKEKHFPGKGILVRTGALLDSMTQLGAPGNITVITQAGAVFGSSVPYGPYHDSDEPRRSNLPERNFSETSDQRKQIWVGQIQTAILHNFEKYGIQVSGDSLL